MTDPVRRNWFARWIAIGCAATIVLAGAAAGYLIWSSRHDRMLRRYHFEMQSGLRNLESFQAIYYSDHKRYASDACADGGLCARLGVTAPAQISLTSTGTETGWSAVAKHAALPNERCDIYVGDARSPGVSTLPGIVTCTIF